MSPRAWAQCHRVRWATTTRRRRSSVFRQIGGLSRGNRRTSPRDRRRRARACRRERGRSVTECVGRLLREGGGRLCSVRSEDFLAATEGLRRVIVGAGPVHVAESVGAVSPSALGDYYEKAAVVCVPSDRRTFSRQPKDFAA